MKRCARLVGGPLDGQLVDVESNAENIIFPMRRQFFGRSEIGRIVYRYRGLNTFGSADFHFDGEWHPGQRMVAVGVYECRGCGKEYRVNDAWGRCLPYLCHACAPGAVNFVAQLLAPPQP